MATEIKVKTERLVRAYHQGATTVKALNNVDLSISAGEFTALVGPSGSGKTTLLNMIGALDRPTSGKVFVEQQDLSAMSQSGLAGMRRDRIGFVFQSYNLIPVLTALENTEFVLDLQKVPFSQKRQRAMEVLAEMGLKGFEHRRPDELSGGQQQRVAIARAIAPRPAILLADEPTANLDSKTAEALLDTMVELNNNERVTFLFSTHDDRVVARAKRVVTLVDGAIAADDVR